MKYVAVHTPVSGGNSPSKVKESYDYVIKSNAHHPYELLRSYIKETINANKNENIIVISEDKNIIGITNNVYKNQNKNIKTIYVCNDPTYVSSDIIYLGVDTDIADDVIMDELNNKNIIYYTLKKINQIGLQNILSQIIMEENVKIHLVIDLRIIDELMAPSVIRSNTKNFMILSQVKQIITYFKNNISYLDILGFNESKDNDIYMYSKITGETCRYIMRELFDITENQMNIFTDNSRFLIYRSVEQEETYSEESDPDNSHILDNPDIGWKIVRFMTLKERDAFIREIGDNIITIEYENENKEINEVYITTTTIEEQNMKSYFVAKDIFDCCLFPQEKMFMVFELLNSNKQNQTNHVCNN